MQLPEQTKLQLKLVSFFLVVKCHERMRVVTNVAIFLCLTQQIHYSYHSFSSVALYFVLETIFLI